MTDSEHKGEDPVMKDDPHSPGSQPDADTPPPDLPRTSEGSVVPQTPATGQADTGPSEDAEPTVEYAGRPLLIFLNEVAGGRKLLEATRRRADQAAYVAVVAPQNNPAVGQIVDAGELRDAARSRVDVTLAILAEFGIEAVGEVMDRDPALALDDAIRAHEPAEVLLSCLYDTRFGLTRKDLVEWARSRFEPDTAITHIPVRVEEDAIRWDVTHTLVVATQTVNSPDLVGRLKELNRERPHRYTIISPRSGDLTREQVSARLASTLAELYREEVDATGQPMSPDPFHAVQNAIEHYRIDEILISTLSGETSKWLQEDLIGRVREITEKPVEHVEAGRPAEAVAAAVASGEEAAAVGSERGEGSE